MSTPQPRQCHFPHCGCMQQGGPGPCATRKVMRLTEGKPPLNDPPFIAPAIGDGMPDLHAMRQNIVAHLEKCLTIAYGAGHHFAQHGKHAPSSKMAQADADAKLINLIEEYAQAHAAGVEGKSRG